MTNPVKHLFNISQKPTRNILGLMSGTSLDGLDLALCNISGTGFNSNLDILAFDTFPYDKKFTEQLKKIFARETISLPELTLLHRDTGLLHATMVCQFLKKHNIPAKTVDLIASHGQTAYHIPSSPANKAATLQIGDADEIATHTGIITVSDFRQQHIAANGEGAPLVPYGDLLLFASPVKNRFLINIGGIANLSYIPAGKRNILCTDTGPGNCLMNEIMQSKFNRPFDENGEIARSGKRSNQLLDALLTNDFFLLPIPKSTGAERFNLQWLESIINSMNLSLPAADEVHTLTALTAISISNMVKQTMESPHNTEVFISGGGSHNQFLVQLLKEELAGLEVHATMNIGIDPDAKEAAIFALLANECVAGDPSIYNGTGLLPVRMGKISFPGNN